MTKDVSIVLCTFNRAESLASTLGDINSLIIPCDIRCELVIVDNNSSDDTSTVIKKFSDDATIDVISLFEQKQGKSHALNLALSMVRGRFLLFTDDDVRVDANWLLAMFTEMDKRGCAVAGGKIIPVWQSEKPDWHTETGEFSLMAAIVAFDRGDEFCELNEPLFGANMCIHKDVMERCGGFRTDLGPRGTLIAKGEDSELIGRILAAGEKVYYIPSAVIRHPVEKERATRSYFRKFYFANGRVTTKTQPLGNEFIRWGGVPRFLIRSLVVNTLKWTTSLDRKKRFYFQLQCCRDLGSITESIRSS